ncbi:MAG: SDR family oxidoreductase [Thermodesulfobacteriota bacterium]
MRINGSTALVLGAAKGIGKAIAENLAEGGGRVIATWFDWPDDAAATWREFEGRGFDFLPVRVDLRDPEQVAGLFRGFADRGDRLDILINNIERGGMPVVHGPYLSEQWDLEMETTLKAKWWVVRHAMPLLRARPEAVIVTLSSIAGLVGRSGPAALIFNDGYAAANRAISSFTETWAREGAPTVRVNELMLGFFETRHAEKTRGWGLLSEEQRRAILATALLGRSGTLTEVVRAVRFLVEDASYMTGSVLRLDGGYVPGQARVAPMPPGVDR